MRAVLGRAGMVAATLAGVILACEEPLEPGERVPSSVVITPFFLPSPSLTAIGTTQQLTATVKDQRGDTLANAAVTWSTSNAGIITVDTTGLVTAVANGGAQITAKSGRASATVTVSVGQAAAQVVKVSGDAQTDTVGQTLPQPLVVQVSDATGHAMAGVSVGFAAMAGSGSTGSATATTNASGQAQTTWTLGQTAGNQTARATVGALPPAVFTATATATGTPGLTLIASGLNSALYVTAPPGDSLRAFVVQQNGTIHVLRRDSLLATPFLNLSGIISYGGERGLLSLAFHPNYASNGFFYVDYTALDGALTVARYHVSADSNVGDPASGQVILSIPHSSQSNHNGGLVLFGPDGYLYVGTGDGGGGGDPDGNGQDSTVLLGKILRIDVDGAFPYAIPPSNPFVGRAPAAPEVWAYGMRNPWRFSFDRLTADFYIGDVGQIAWEEIDFAPAGDLGGHNYGWNTIEGTHCYSPMTGCVTTGLTLPVYEYGHTGGNCSITGGYVYRGTRNPTLAGRYFFADYCVSRVRSLLMVGGVATDLRDEFTQLSELTSFGEDGRGELYVVRASGQVYRISPP